MLTTPTGHTYITEPHGASMFPALAQPTGELEIQPALDPPDTDRSAMMPRRKQTREQDRRDRTTPNAANKPNSLPKKIANVKPGSPPTTNHHPSEAESSVKPPGRTPF